MGETRRLITESLQFKQDDGDLVQGRDEGDEKCSQSGYICKQSQQGMPIFYMWDVRENVRKFLARTVGRLELPFIERDSWENEVWGEETIQEFDFGQASSRCLLSI